MVMNSHLFLLRVWREFLGDDKVEWRGRIQSLHNGEVRHFRNADSLYQALLRILEDVEGDISRQKLFELEDELNDGLEDGLEDGFEDGFEDELENKENEG